MQGMTLSGFFYRPQYIYAFIHHSRLYGVGCLDAAIFFVPRLIQTVLPRYID